MNRRIWLFLALAALAVIGVSGIASASYPSGATEQTKGGGGTDLSHAQDKDGFNALSPGLKAVSMSTLKFLGYVTPQELTGLPKPAANQEKNSPNVAVVWGGDHQTGAGNEPSAVVHPSSPLYALVSGNNPIDNTTNGGTTWQTRLPPNPNGFGDVVVSFLPGSPSQDWAFEAALNSGHGATITSGRSTDRGVTWANFPTNIDTTTWFNDREYLWVDQTVGSPFYGRLYVTGTFFDTGGSGSFNSTWIKWSSDNGTTWSSAFTEDAHALSATNGNAQFSSVGFGPNGTIYHGWMNVRCCGDPPSFGTNNFYKWAKSTDGGVTFPISGTAATDVAARSVSFNSNGPAGFRWSPQATLAADPGDNNVYMVWLKKRVDNSNSGVAVSFTRSSDGGTTWNTPSFVFDDPQPNDTQYMPWIIVSPDHTIHVTYSSSIAGVASTMAHFYVQSTDRGATWSAPFQLSTSTYAATGFQGDYQGTHIGNLTNCTALAIIASWTAGSGGHHANIGSFPGCGGTPTPTSTGTPPTATPTVTRTNTAVPTGTPCAILLNEGFEAGTLGAFTNVVPTCVPGGCGWTSVASNPHSGTRSAFAPDVANISDQYLEQTTGIAITAGSSLTFWHSFNLENGFDGGVLEATTNNGSTWTDMGPNITVGGYNGTISTSFGSPISGRQAWTGNFATYAQVTVNLAPYVGQSLRIRFREATDNSVSAVGWNVDDVQILGGTCGSVTPVTNTPVPPTATGAVPTATCAAGGGPIIVNGALDASDPTLVTRMFRDDPASSCAVPQPYPGTSGTGPFSYETHTFPNSTGAPACVTINVDPLTCTGTPFIHASAYLNTFDPNNLETNYLGDIGASPTAPLDFSVTVPAGQSIVVVVNAVTAGAGGACPGFTLTITGLGGAGCATPGTVVPTPTCAAGPGVWTAAQAYPVTNVRYGFAQVGNSFYVIGGVSDGSRISDVNRYDVATNTWTALAPIPVASEAPACAYNAGANKIYCAEGDTGNSFQIYDVAANTWAAGPAVPGAANRYGAAAGSSGNLVYIVGGSTSFQSDTQVFNIGTNTWSTGTAAANPLLLPGYQTVGQYLYVVGGFSGTPSGAKAGTVPGSIAERASKGASAPDANNPTTLRLDMTTGTWSTGPAFTPGRADFGLAYSGGSLYAIGGDADGGAFFDSTQLVDSLDVSGWPAGSWAASPPNLPSPARQANQAGFTSTDGRIWSTGGIVGQTFQFISDHIYRGSGGCVTPVATNTPGTVVPTPTCAAGGITEGFESGTLGAFTNVVPICNPGGCNWVSVASNPHSGTRSAFAPDGGDISDQYLELTNPFVPAAGNTLTFWHSYDTEATFDGGVLEATTNNGSTWTDMEPNITSGGYDGPISTSFGSPIGGRNAWNGSSGGYIQTSVNLTPYAGQSLRIRFRLATDNSVSAVGWNIDDIVIGGGCGGATSTPVAPTATPCVASFAGEIGLGNPGKPNLVSNGTGNGSLASSNRTFGKSVTPKKSVYNPLGPVTFILDDGVLEDAISLNNGSTNYPAVWINRFSPTAGQYPLTLNQISVLFPDPSVAGANLVGRAIDLLVYLDTDGNNDPANATKLLQQSETITVADSVTFSNYAVNVVVSGPGDVYIGFSDTYNSGGVSPVTFPASIDQTASQVRSWVAGMSTNTDPDYDNLGNNDLLGTIDSFGLPGNWLIRANGTVGGGGGGCTVTPTPSTPVATPTCAAGGVQLLQDTSFEDGTPNSFWTEASTNFGTPLCDAACGGGGTTGPRTGAWYTWFGGIDAVEDASVEQTVNIPAGAATLQFYLWIGAHSGMGQSDYMRALVNGVEVFRADDGSTAYDAGYVLVSVDVSAQSGGSRVVRLESHNEANGLGEVFNASVDDVTLTTGGGGCATSTPVPPTSTGVATNTPVTPVATDTPVGATETVTTGPTETSTTVPTPTVCPIQFTDVPTGHTFYADIRCLACRGIVSGYNTNCPSGNPCFKPENNVTRGQLSKMASNSAGFTDPASGQQYQDVPPGSTFYDYIYRLDLRGYINGYPCGGPGEPCIGPTNLPYFRPNASVTRGQLSKIVSNAAGFSEPAGAQQYEDVLPGSTFYDYIWRLTDRGVMQGYPCGGPGEPCVGPANLPYFRPGANATRGQASKIVANTFFPGCVTPFRPERLSPKIK